MQPRHLFARIVPGPDGRRSAACPVCREPADVPGRGGWVPLRCGTCGTEFVATGETKPPRPPVVVARPKRRRERVILREPGVLVSDVRLVVAGYTFNLESVLACRLEVEPGRWVWPRESLLAIAGAAGILALCVAPASLAAAGGLPAVARLLGGAVTVVLLAIGVAVARLGWAERYYRLERYRVVLDTPTGEVTALVESDEELAGRVVAALREAGRPAAG